MNEMPRRVTIIDSAVHRISVVLTFVTFAVLLTPGYSAAAVVTENFNNFTCPGAWQQDPSGVNTSYVRDCGNGWFAYARDSIGPNNIGNQNIVDVDNSANGPSAAVGDPNAMARIYTDPGFPPRGTLWLYKTFPVEAGVPIQTLKADFRLKLLGGTLRTVYGLYVFDGVVTPTDGLASQMAKGTYTDGDYTLVSDACYGLASQWCAWRTSDLGSPYLVPSTSYITVGFRLQDSRDTEQMFGELDNLTISGVVTTAESPLPINDLAKVWAKNYLAAGTGLGTGNMAEAADIAVDSARNSYVVGSVYNGLNYDFVTIKYDDTGSTTPLWSQTYDGGSGDKAVAIALGPLGNVYVVGRGYNGTDNDYAVVKYDTNGSELWHSTFDNAGQNDVPTSLAVNSSGVYVTGNTCGTATACDYYTLRIDPATGTQMGSALIYNGTATGNELDKAVSVKLDSSGNIYVTGTSSGASDDIVTIKYDSAGNKLWESHYDSGWNDRATALGVDPVTGDSYVAGMTYAGGSPAILALKYDSSGNQVWASTYSGSASETLPSAMTIDSSGNVYVTGKTGRVLDHDVATVKFNSSDGSIAWGHTYGNVGFDDWGVDIAVDAAGNTFVLGTLSRGPGNTDLVTLKYDATGAPTSAITYDGFTLADSPAALALGVDPQGDTVPYITGETFDLNGVTEIETVRYTKARADLTVTATSGPVSGVVGGSINIDYTVLNISDLANKKYNDTGAFDIGLYLAPGGSGVPDLNNLILLGTVHVTNLAPGQTSMASDPVTIPSTVAEGSYYAVVVADVNNNVVEADETNNTKVALAAMNITASKPDLAVTSFTGPSSITRDVAFNVTTTVSNLVSSAAGSFSVGFYLSTDPTFATLDYAIGSRTITSLNGLSSNTATTSLTVNSANVPAGTYYLAAIADDLGQVAEVNENNNLAVLGGASNSTLLTTGKDFLAGLPGSNVAVFGSGIGGHVQLAQSAVTWTPNSAGNLTDLVTAAYAKLSVRDMNKDGLIDAMLGSYNGVVYGYVNTGSATLPSWSVQSNWNVPAPTAGDCPGQSVGSSTDATFASPTIGDMNGDGTPDIMLVGMRSGVCAYQNTGSATAPAWAPNAAWDLQVDPNVPLTNKFNNPTLGDLDGDGVLDMMVGQVSGTTVFAFKGSNSPPYWTYMPTWNYVASASMSRAAPKLADINGDGKLDMLIGTYNGNVVGVINTGTSSSPAWSPNGAWDVGDIGTAAGPALADLNGDGRIDALIGDSTGAAQLWENTGPFYANTGTPDGVYTSKVIDAGNHGGFTTLSYVSEVPTGTSLTVDIRAGDTTNPLDGSWTLGGAWYTGILPGGDISFLGTHRYVQYQVNLTSTDANQTPALYSIQANTSPPSAPQTAVAVVVGDGGGGGGEVGIIELLLMSLGLIGGARRWRDGCC